MWPLADQGSRIKDQGSRIRDQGSGFRVRSLQRPGGVCTQLGTSTYAYTYTYTHTCTWAVTASVSGSVSVFSPNTPAVYLAHAINRVGLLGAFVGAIPFDPGKAEGDTAGIARAGLHIIKGDLDDEL